jgi:hypothetical protein
MTMTMTMTLTMTMTMTMTMTTMTMTMTTLAQPWIRAGRTDVVVQLITIWQEQFELKTRSKLTFLARILQLARLLQLVSHSIRIARTYRYGGFDKRSDRERWLTRERQHEGPCS